MNMLPITSEWKRRMKWADKQRKQQQPKAKSQGQAKCIKQVSNGGRA